MAKKRQSIVKSAPAKLPDLVTMLLTTLNKGEKNFFVGVQRGFRMRYQLRAPQSAPLVQEAIDKGYLVVAQRVGADQIPVYSVASSLFVEAAR